ncbi:MULTISPECIES: hypothetical protein [Protofrankia]|uniref:Uncharacterized protein n=1 Tax=Candidatus Protofrankia datiscae TaxID=2716812 RepID=F8B2S7_9ACTN|nr:MULTISPECIES: hypothetical protein [Protofrankia]AEH07802.1 hypothetical protein FsymDg_0230 [Candidatus Protofrankia datiscae]
MTNTGELFLPVPREPGPTGPTGSVEPVRREFLPSGKSREQPHEGQPREELSREEPRQGPGRTASSLPAGPAGTWPAVLDTARLAPSTLPVMPVAIPAARTPPDDHLDTRAVPEPPGHTSSPDELAAGFSGDSPADGQPPLPEPVAAAGPPMSDRRQFHLYAGAAMVGALLPDTQLADLVDVHGTTAQAAIAHAEGQLTELLGTHEQTSPAQVITETLRLRHYLDQLAQRQLTASDARRLRIAAGRATVLHADAAFKLGEPEVAGALAAAGFAAGEWAGDGPLRGSAREIGAVAEFYGGRPDVALRLARDGLRYVSAGPVRARLVCQEARALAALGDVRGAARALDLAYEFADMIPVEQWGSPGPGFDTFHPVEVAYNATTALCLLGRSRAAEEHAQFAIPRLDAMNAPGFRSVIRLDLALALACQGRLELDRVCALATEAISISWGRAVASVSNRADQLLAVTRAHGEVREVRELAAYVRGWQREGQRQPAGPDAAVARADAASTQAASTQAAGAVAAATKAPAGHER